MNINAHTLTHASVSLKALASLRLALAGLFYGLLSLHSTVIAATSTTEVILYNLSYTPSIQQILQTTIVRSLELTREEYGDYTLSNYPFKTSETRIKGLVENGTKIHLFFSTQHVTSDAERTSSHIEVPFLSSVLGLRIFLTKEQDAEQVNRVNSIDDLRAFNAGMGHTWAEKNIFKAHNIPYREALLASSLMLMLEKNRFDYIAISALDDVAAMGSSQQAIITTLKDIMLYYPIPIQLNVSSKHPQLAIRLKKGLARFTESGEAMALIKTVFDDHGIFQDEQLVRLLFIANPFFSEEKNQQALKILHQQFPQQFIMIQQ